MIPVPKKDKTYNLVELLNLNTVLLVYVKKYLKDKILSKITAIENDTST